MSLIKRVKESLRLAREQPEGQRGVELIGHRDYVGGRWEEIGRLQFEMAVSQGLRPEHVFLDIACGALRGGVHFIHYLDPRNYLGIDKEPSLIEAGLKQELPQGLKEEKQPEFVISERFEFNRFSKQPNYALAQSLFTHLTPKDIQLCLRNLRSFVSPGHVFLVTFFEGENKQNPVTSHSHGIFVYSHEQMIMWGDQLGWTAEYIGNWNHPRDQKLIRYTAR